MRTLALAVLAPLLLAAAEPLDLIELHDPTGRQAIFINPYAMTSLREPLVSQHFAPGTHCLIYVTNRNMIAVREPCEMVRQRLRVLRRGG